MWNKKYEKIFLLLAALCMAALVMAGCGGSSKESLTAKTFKEITDKTGVHMEIEMLADNSRTTIGLAKKDDNLYAYVEQNGAKAIVISDGKTVTTLDPSTKTMVQEPINDEYQKQLDQISAAANAITEAGENVGSDYEEGTVTYDGEEYDTETFKDGDDTVTFGYKDGKLGYFALEKDGQKQVMKILAMDGKVDEALFLIPENYKAVDRDSDPQPSNTGSENTKNDRNSGGGSGYKTINAVGASVGSAGTGTPTGKYKTMISSEGNFSFEMDKAFTSETSDDGKKITVCTEKGKKVPNYSAELMVLTGSVDGYLENFIKNLNKSQGDQMTTRPIKTRIEVGGKVYKGVEYVVKSGDSQMVCINYTYSKGKTNYRLAGYYIEDDMTTPYAIQHMLETFKVD